MGWGGRWREGGCGEGIVRDGEGTIRRVRDGEEDGEGIVGYYPTVLEMGKSYSDDSETPAWRRG